MRVIPEHPSKLARIGSCLAVMGSLVWVQWPIDFQNLNIAGVILLIGSLVTWLGIELADFSNGNSAHDGMMVDDVNKLNSLLKLVDRHQAYILREHAIETSMHDTDYDGIQQLVRYHNDDIFPFHNKNIQVHYEQLCRDAEKFLRDLFNLYTSDGRGWMTWRVAGEGWVSQDVYDRVMSRIGELNRQTSLLSQTWEELITLALAELKGASQPINRYE
ncbi:hypothetical protein CES85_2244 [Ochrobactrum quorumnocens]|uniref:Uncharacterized protein n=1 Tax=Ochrobactrum quorumnocens TaxID=271865 RepID=A0A248UIJ6_9HYPH|nr:hypothetical protein [[Ochrobactrum] quorumnocens]ASV86657.1 hypothetical protein CES85_2244 [[Ochrobactrum] quorumnocens]